jgi:hypothetical protein
MKVIFFAWFLVFSLAPVKGQKPISFTSEYIDFKIDSMYFSINGIYVFRNNTGSTIIRNILFPFAVNTDLIDSIRIIDLDKLRAVQFMRNDKSISFNLQLSPHDTIEYNIFYRQKTASQNTYILTTTKSWGEPLEKAVYTLVINKYVKVSSFSFDPDTSHTDSLNSIYIWNENNFTPPVDFIVSIKKNSE